MQHDLKNELIRNPLFCEMDEPVIANLSASTTWVHLRGGDVLMYENEPSDSLYILVTGRLRVELGGGRYADVGIGESVGELGVLTGKPRSSTVRAVRDCRLIGMSRVAMFRALQSDSQALLSLSQIVIERLQANAQAQRPVRGNFSTLAVLQAGQSHQRDEFLSGLLHSLQSRGSAMLLDEAQVNAALGEGACDISFDAGQANVALIDWLNQMEAQHQYLIYTAASDSPTWLRRCLRQSDRVLLLTDGVDAVNALALDTQLQQSRLEVPLELVLPHSNAQSDLKRLRQRYRSDGHYYCNVGCRQDIDRLSRQLTGHANGLVLGGGGARGFAHIGLLQALDELGMQIDLAGGSSMGALIAALKALGLSPTEVAQEIRATFVDNNYLNDYMIPRVALIRGRRFLRRMREIFGDRQIEHLPMTYFCVSTNLSSGQQQVHRDGDLATWVATSMAVPGVSPPVGWNGDLLADGAVINALPADVMAQMARGPVIASNVSTEGAINAPGVIGPDPEILLNWVAPSPRPNLMSILFRTATLSSENGNRKRAEQADICLQMPVQDVGMFQWDALDELIERGYRHAMTELTAQRDLFEAERPH